MQSRFGCFASASCVQFGFLLLLCISQRDECESSEAAANTPTQLSLVSGHSTIQMVMKCQMSNFAHNIATVLVQKIS